MKIDIIWKKNSSFGHKDVFNNTEIKLLSQSHRPLYQRAQATLLQEQGHTHRTARALFRCHFSRDAANALITIPHTQDRAASPWLSAVWRCCPLPPNFQQGGSDSAIFSRPQTLLLGLLQNQCPRNPPRDHHCGLFLQWNEVTRLVRGVTDGHLEDNQRWLTHRSPKVHTHTVGIHYTDMHTKTHTNIQLHYTAHTDIHKHMVEICLTHANRSDAALTRI